MISGLGLFASGSKGGYTTVGFGVGVTIGGGAGVVMAVEIGSEVIAGVESMVGV